MALVYCQNKLVLPCSANGIMAYNAPGCQAVILVIIGTKIYFPVLPFSNQVVAKLLQQLKSSFKRTIIWKKHK